MGTAADNDLYKSLYTLGMYAGSILPAIFALSMTMEAYKKRRQVDAKPTGLLTKFMDFFLLGSQVPSDPPAQNKKTQKADNKKEKTGNAKTMSLLFCTVGLQTAYLLWGVLQEKIMTTEYDGVRFTSATLLVLMNRILSVVFALVVVILYSQPPHRAPALEYSFASAANVLSSFCQYEALIYISFPMQTVAKACKVIPTMIMGTFVQKKSFSVHDYIGAALISVGVAAFSQLKSGKSISVPTFDQITQVTPSQTVGFCLLIGYLTFDSFTSNWQGKLFSTYKISSFQCMLGINSCSCLISIANLIQSGELVPNLTFLHDHPSCLQDMFIMAVASSVGQLFIFYTISEHGPVVFTIISVTRQLLSIILSSFLYGHVIPTPAWGAVLVTFTGILYRIFAKQFFAPKQKSKIA